MLAPMATDELIALAEEKDFEAVRAGFRDHWGRTDEACRAYDDVLERNAAHTWTIKRYALLLHRLGEEERARRLLRDAAERGGGNRFAALNYLEYLLIADDDGYAPF